MTDHTDEPAGSTDKTLTWVPIVAALAVILVVGAVIFFAGVGEDNQIGTKADESGALVCPRNYEVRRFTPKPGATPVKAWVPVDPSGVDGGPELVPDSKPSHVVLCKYVTPALEVRGTVPVALTDRIRLESDLADATRDLSTSAEATDAGAATRSCTYRRDSYLAGITFATGVIWVSVPGNCAYVSNGDFVSSRDLHDKVAKAYTDRTWPTS